MDLLDEYGVNTTFNAFFFYLSLFDIGDDFRSNPFKKRKDDAIQTTPNDL